MIKFSEFLIFLAAASLPVTYLLIMRHYITKNEAEDLANLSRTGAPEAHDCCCELAAKALAGKAQPRKMELTAH
ncbi:MAG: hypothetical protein B9S33_03095 [Pedosphaera sp. Tous-C6FEB]|nr:MAG: hypothetical protein B9S33_03095 [Pedosphaera sp. Tous-C6FEB]